MFCFVKGFYKFFVFCGIWYFCSCVIQCSGCNICDVIIVYIVIQIRLNFYVNLFKYFLLLGDEEIKRNVVVLMGEEDLRNLVVEFIGKFFQF